VERRTATRKLLDHLIEGGLEQFAREQRTAGKSWRQISMRINDRFGEDVHPETLRLWFPDMAKGVAA